MADIFRGQGETGGALLVTDMRRINTIFEVETGLAAHINERMASEGSNLSGVTTQYFAWAAIDPQQLSEPIPGEQAALARMRKRGGRKKKMHLTASMLPASSSSGHPPNSSASTAMETDDSGSVTTLHQASSVVRSKQGQYLLKYALIYECLVRGSCGQQSTRGSKRINPVHQMVTTSRASRSSNGYSSLHDIFSCHTWRIN